MVIVNGNIQPLLPSVSSLAHLRTKEVATSVFDYCMKSSDVDQIFSDKELATRLIKSAMMLIRIETWHQRTAFGSDGRLKVSNKFLPFLFHENCLCQSKCLTFSYTFSPFKLS